MFLIKTFDASFPTVELWLAQTNLCVCVCMALCPSKMGRVWYTINSAQVERFKQQGGIGSDSAAFFLFVLTRFILIPWFCVAAAHLVVPNFYPTSGPFFRLLIALISSPVCGEPLTDLMCVATIRVQNWAREGKLIQSVAVKALDEWLYLFVSAH